MAYRFLPVVRLFARTPDGRLEDTREEFDLECFGGMLPAPGDVISSPWIVVGGDRQDPEKRTVYEVVRRYFSPQHGDPKRPDEKIFVYVAFEVIERRGRPDERGIFNN